MECIMFEALADHTRRRIVESLQSGEKPVGEIVKHSRIHQSGVSRHLRILHEAGLVSMRPQGQQRFYALRSEPFRRGRHDSLRHDCGGTCADCRDEADGLEPSHAVQTEPAADHRACHRLRTGEKPDECTIAVDFFPAGESVRLVVTVEPMRDEEFTQRSIKGFISQLRKLEGRFAEWPAPPDACAVVRASVSYSTIDFSRLRRETVLRALSR
jgi:DNA-binding transcriptional ArsR family regulator